MKSREVIAPLSIRLHLAALCTEHTYTVMVRKTGVSLHTLKTFIDGRHLPTGVVVTVLEAMREMTL